MKRQRAQGWSLPDILREATANLMTSRSRARAVVAAAVLLGSCTAGIEAFEWARFHERVDEAIGRGGATVLFFSPSAEQGEGIDELSCDRLRLRPDVVAAGFSSDAGQHITAALGGQPKPTVRLSINATRPNELGDRGNGAIGSILLPDTAFPYRGARTFFDDESRSIARRQRIPGTQTESSVVLISAPTPGSYANRCIVQIDRTSTTKPMGPVLGAALRVRGEPPVLEQPDTLDVLFRNFETRFSRFLPAAAAVLVGAIALVSWKSRSSEIASYLLSGTKRMELATLLTLETSIAMAFGNISALAAFVTISTLTETDISPGSYAAASIGWVVASLAMTPLALLFAASDPLRLSKDR